MRTQQHEVDTEARKLVPAALPRHFEHRELSGRDYGIDLAVEIFNGGQPTGKMLLLQIKGTDGELKRTKNGVYFDLEVSFVKYALLFSAPFILCVCAVNERPASFRYVWVQEYERAVLRRENPNWASQSYVRFTMPDDNVMPGNDNRLSFIAGYPQRQEDWTQLARIIHHLGHAFPSNDVADLEPNNFATAARWLDEASRLTGIFGDPAWHWGQTVKTKMLEPAQRACALALRGAPFSDTDLQAVGQETTGIAPHHLNNHAWREFVVKSAAMTGVNQLSAALATANDYGIKHGLWTEMAEHDF